MNKSEQLRSMVAQGWTTMSIIYVANLTMEIVRNTLNGESFKFVEHMGTEGIQFILVLLSIYTLMPVLVRSVSARWFRVFVVGVTALVTLFVVAHEISHTTGATGIKPFGLLHALDITHHVVGVYVTVVAAMWARQPAGSKT